MTAAELLADARRCAPELPWAADTESTWADGIVAVCATGRTWRAEVVAYPGGRVGVSASTPGRVVRNARHPSAEAALDGLVEALRGGLLELAALYNADLLAIGGGR